jgi:hypothetical protein
MNPLAYYHHYSVGAWAAHMVNAPPVIITRQEAKALGLPRYFTGQECERGIRQSVAQIMPPALSVQR